MEPGEMVVARLSGGIAVARYLGEADSRARLALGRNREARIPTERIVLATGMALSGKEAVEEFRHRCEELASEIDLAEVWAAIAEERRSVSLDDLVELYWGRPADAAQRVALLLHLHRTPQFFLGDGEGFSPRSKESVDEDRARREREEEQARETESLMEHLSDGVLPSQMTEHQSGLLEHLRSYAVHGDSYGRSALARELTQMAASGTRELQRAAFDLLVEAGVLHEDEPLELERAGIRKGFPEEALAEAGAVQMALGSGDRNDLTSVPTITIDDSGTLDRDDALSVELETPDFSQGPGPDPDAPRQDPNVYRVGVHIADAGALIPRDSALDSEADRRMATLYLPDLRVPMLPAELCDRKGSLLPGEQRSALSLSVRITESGEVLAWELFQSTIRSDAALSYDEADRIVDDGDGPWRIALLTLSKIAGSLRRRRDEAGAMRLERPEMLIKAAPPGELVVKVVPRETGVRMAVGEFMILCNSLMAEYCRREDIPAAYRSQPASDTSEFEEPVPEGPLRWYVLMRRMPPANLSTVPERHAGLGVSAYIQATSPLRRYPDLVMQRQISHFLSSGTPAYPVESIASVIQRAEVQLKELSVLEEERRRYWFLKYLQQTTSQTEDHLFPAVVLENRPRPPALLELVEYPFRVRAALPSGCVPGETVTLRLHGVDLWSRTGQFVHVLSHE